MTTLYFVEYNTESGDEGAIGYFTEKPTDGHLTAYFKKHMPDEFVEEYGETRRLVYWKVHELRPMKLPKPVKPIPSI